MRDGLSKYDMKNTVAMHIENQLKSLENYKNKSLGFEFRERMKTLSNQGSLDYDLKRSYNYMINYIETMQKYAGRPYYEEFMKVLKSFSNPKMFYEKIKNSELGSDLHYQSDETLKQIELEELMREWGVDIDSNKIDIQEETQEIEVK